MSYKYLVVDDEVSDNPVGCDTEEEALKEAKYMLEENDEFYEASKVAIYKLQKIGVRQTTIDWKENTDTIPVPKGGGHNQLWTDEERSYLIAARKRKMDFSVIAANLGRTQRAVELQYDRLT